MTYVLYADVMLIWSSIINAVVLALAAAILNMRIKKNKGDYLGGTYRCCHHGRIHFDDGR